MVKILKKGRKGKVFLVGAGPGDPRLATVKAVDCLAEADIIFYDELVNPSLLKYAKKGAECVYIGKKGGSHTCSQNEINRLLIESASCGKTVCRLKGGDPFLFGRGGEEACFLAENNIEYEVIPGVTSAIAVPAYAGIPVTQRGLASGVAIFTGQEDLSKPSSGINWKAAADLGVTLVFLMGMKNLQSIVENLISNGMDASTPAAVIFRGATPFQKTVQSTLGKITDEARMAGLEAPSVIIIGKVTSLRDTLKWFEKKPLFGKKILVTRAKRQADELVNLLSSEGASVYEFPTIEVEPNHKSFGELDACIRGLSEFDWVVFKSVNGVEIFFERMAFLGLDSRAFGGVKVCAIGPATGVELKRYAINPDVVPAEYVAEAVLRELKDRVKGKRVLLLESDRARDFLSAALEKEGAFVRAINIYSTKVPLYSSEFLKSLLKEVDITTFTSSSTVDNFALILGDDIEEYRKRFVAASIGPITSEAVRRHGFDLACEAVEYTIPGLVRAIVNYFREGDK